MTQIEDAMHHIAKLPGANVDWGFGQDRNVLRKQYEFRIGEEISDLYIEGKLESYQDFLSDLKTWTYPHKIPEDYLDFLDLYGGLLIEKTEYTLMVNGFGPMCYEWYLPLIPEESSTEPSRDGLLQIGRLEFTDFRQDSQSVLFFIDLAGQFQQNSILGIGSWREENLSITQIITNPPAYSSAWKILANSFTEWIELVKETQGTFGYVKT